MRRLRLSRRDRSCEHRVSVDQNKDVLITLRCFRQETKDVHFDIVECGGQRTVAMVAWGGTGYRFVRRLRIKRQAYIQNWSYSVSSICVGSYPTFGVDPAYRRFMGNERDARYVTANLTAILLLLPRTQGNF